MNILKRFLMSVGTKAVKAAGGVTFDPVNAEWYARNGYPQIYNLLTGGLPAWSGETVSLNSALNHSVVWACNRIISESIGFIPAILVQEKNGDTKEATDHPMYRAMKLAPNEEITAQHFTETLTSHTVLGGNAFARIIRRSGNGTAIELRHLVPDSVKIDIDSKNRIVYEQREDRAPNRTFTVEPGKEHDILHIRGLGWDGIRGYSVITMGRQSIGGAIAAERNVSNFWKAGGRKPYLLNLLQKFKKEEDYKAFRQDWEDLYADSSKVPIIEPWLKYEEIGMSMKDAQMIETRQFSIPEICRWFSISPHLVGDLSRATFSNIEHLFIQFLQMTLQTWLNRWEQEFYRCVLTAKEKAQGYQIRHNVDELLRGDFKTRMEGYAAALQNGFLSIDEVRKLERRNKLPEGAGSHYHIQLNMTNVEDIGEEPMTAREEPKGLRRVKFYAASETGIK